jgi:putative ABC transport system permease protein
MTFFGLAARNALRNKLRTLLTVFGVTVALLTFVLLRTVIYSWTAAVEHAAKDRIGTRHKVSFIMLLPLRYVEEIRQIPAVTSAAFMQWFGGKDPRPQYEKDFFATIAVEPRTFLGVYDEIALPNDQVESWVTNRRGAIVGDVLAKKHDWKVGDEVTLESPIFAGEWRFQVSGIYTTTRRSMDRTSLFLHWAYLNETAPPGMKDMVGWIAAKVDDPGKAAQISRAIDAHFEDRDLQTLSMSEKALNNSFLGMLSAVLDAINLVSVVILVIMMLILGNTIAMGVRERTSEYGALRAVGFQPRHIAGFVLGEAAVIGVLGSVLALVLAYPFVEKGLGRFLEENMGSFFPYFRIPLDVAVAAVALGVGLAALAALLPAYRASRLNVIDALRRVG